ncbi:MAG: molybdopterin-synthase adenylyltransferase MoeB [Deltaproteobacteria bacterium]|nr:molybdopterin-synthase adenylyltransferase MoeB [Deltaproteobacteria bacterium]
MENLNREQLIARTKASIRELSPEDVSTRLRTPSPPVLVDVREADELAGGSIPSARHIPRGFLELRIEDLVPSRETEIILFCQAGNRSALAAKTLGEMGYRRVSSLSGGFASWKTKGLPWDVPRTLSEEQLVRYSRHLALPEVGAEGQKKLLSSRVLLVGAGGLGSPVALYLAAAGVGTIGVVDPDTVDRTNLQRQILHRDADVGLAKVESAARAITELNPDVRVTLYKEKLTSDNAMRILDDGWHVVADGCDNFPTRYLINDACVFKKVPNVHGSIFRFEGQASVFAPHLGGPCYRCLYPEPPPAELTPNCDEAGVIGALPGIIGTIQALEVLKVLLAKGEPLVGRLLQYDALAQRFRELRIKREPSCPVCGENPTIDELIDYEEFCSVG